MFGLIKTAMEAPIIERLPRNNVTKLIPRTKERLIIKYLKHPNIVMAKGRSTSLEVLPVYNQLIAKVEKHFKSRWKLVCYLHFSVINATTTKLLFNLFKVLHRAHRDNKKVTVFWVVDEGNEDLYEIGRDFQEFTDFDFQITQP